MKKKDCPKKAVPFLLTDLAHVCFDYERGDHPALRLTRLPPPEGHRDDVSAIDGHFRQVDCFA